MAKHAFDSLLDSYFKQRLSDLPTEAVAAGLKSGEGSFDEASASFSRDQHKKRQGFLKTAESISPSTLSPDQHLDRLAARSQLTRECFDHVHGREQRDPDAVEGVLGMLMHELMRGEDEPKRAAVNLRSLLNEAPVFLRNSARLVKEPDPNWLANMKDSASGAASLLSAVGTFLKSTKGGSNDTDLIKNCGTAVKRYAAQIGAKPKGKQGSYAIGETELQRRIQSELGLDYSLGEIESLAKSEIARVNSMIKELCRPYGRNKSPEVIVAKARESWNPPADMLGLYRKETARTARVFKKAKVMTFPKGDELDIRLVPDFMKHLFPLAAYSSPGPFDPKQKGVFWVNDLGAFEKNPDKAKAERQQHFGLVLTCAHEAYPGHHLQFITANRHARKWRPLFAHAVFYEGWTLWCEQMTADLEVDSSPWLKIQQLHDALWRCHRILIDLYLQTGEYSYRRAISHMQEHLGMTKARAAADVNWYIGSPSVPMSYWLGRLENQRLHERLVSGRGWSQKKFNDWLLSHGTLPQSWLEKYMLD